MGNGLKPNSPTTARLSAETLRQLAALASLWGENKSRAIARAIALAYSKEIDKKR